MTLVVEASNLASGQRAMYSWRELTISTLIVGSALIFHGLLSRVRVQLRFFVTSPILIVLIIQVTTGFPAFGGFILRQAGVGGGMPIDYVVRQDAQKTQHGCLVLMTSSYFFIEPDAQKQPCPTLARNVTQFLKDGVQPRIGVDTFNHDELRFLRKE